jgi:hypothetical protein
MAFGPNDMGFGMAFGPNDMGYGGRNIVFTNLKPVIYF